MPGSLVTDVGNRIVYKRFISQKKSRGSGGVQGCRMQWPPGAGGGSKSTWIMSIIARSKVHFSKPCNDVDDSLRPSEIPSPLYQLFLLSHFLGLLFFFLIFLSSLFDIPLGSMFIFSNTVFRHTCSSSLL